MMSAALADSGAAEQQPQQHEHSADAWEEIFDVVDVNDRVVRQERRDVVHQQGLLHRSVHIFVTDGENYLTAAVRGLKEELGILATPDGLERLRAAYLHTEHYPEKGLLDNEFTETFVLRGFSGEVNHDPAEVAETAYWTKQQLKQAVAAEPHKFASWFRKELEAVDVDSL